ncbi:MarR family winged helix-turn-helix transcriptional regulator [Aeromicrobium stalagmiti]|uniref:MarR family winged helix-turn-helix transcriptional regulator n=1 Tax=Aeromicrobium stalagmiti TaxID=2738988 RepID=UPI001569AB36|nr:MarR family transcriptional regulator [Aeromicrobium stalagmiti]NRQ51280.1 MarR family transcriptional regulator [Aeromicrobium stalagmiti]
MTSHDHVDVIVSQWAAERPDLDSSPLHVIGRISRLADLIDELLRPVFASEGLGNGDFDVLATLRRNGAPYELTPGELGERTMVTSGAVTKRVDRLVGAGLVERRVSDADGRGRHVRLTSRGKELMDALYPVHLRNEERLLAGLTAEEREQLGALLRKTGASMEAAGTPDMRR